MEQASLLLFSVSSDFSAGADNFDTLTDAPGDSVILTTVEDGSLTEIAADGDLVISKLTLLHCGAFSTASVVGGGSDSTSAISFFTFSTSLRFASKTKLQL